VFASLLYDNLLVSKCCLKYKNRDVSLRFYISNNISTLMRLLYYKHANKNIILIPQTVNYIADFHPLREWKMCQYVIGSARTPCYLVICRRSVIYFLCMYVRNKIHTFLHTILAIIFYDQISVIGFLSCKIKSVSE
jgi:hypothetical protein